MGEKIRSIILYGIFGVLTTAVNFAVYYLFYNGIQVSNVFATVIAWLFAVIFALVTNKIWVFESKSWKRDVIVHEIETFLLARGLTGILDVAIMYFAVDQMHWNATLWKFLSNVIVIILNYTASKCMIFA